MFNNLQAVDYATDIQPIFTNNCIQCHGGTHSTGLDLSSYESVMSGSNNGPVIISGDHSSSLLWQYVNSGFMPMGGADLTSPDVDSIAQWIDNGATLRIFPVQMVNQFQINPIYPNPFNPSATISWEQPRVENIHISIFNLKGELSDEFSFTKSQPGNHSFIWHPAGLPAGVYLIRLTGETFTVTQKAIYVK